MASRAPCLVFLERFERDYLDVRFVYCMFEDRNVTPRWFFACTVPDVPYEHSQTLFVTFAFVDFVLCCIKENPTHRSKYHCLYVAVQQLRSYAYYIEYKSKPTCNGNDTQKARNRKHAVTTRRAFGRHKEMVHSQNCEQKNRGKGNTSPRKHQSHNMAGCNRPLNSAGI